MPPADAPRDLPSPQELALLRQTLMTQKEMAEAIGVDKGQLSRFEAGKGEMSYEKIRRYVHVLNLRAVRDDPAAFIVDRIANRRPLLEVRASDPIERAIEVMTVNGFSQLPVVAASGGEYLGLVTDRLLCAAFADAELETILGRPVGSLPLEPIVRVRRDEVYNQAARLLAQHPMVLVEDEIEGAIGFATPTDLFALAGVAPTSGASRGAGRPRKR